VKAGGADLKGDEAQRYVDSMLGLTREDFAATCYFEQRQMARLILAKPQERTDVVAAWLRLEPLIRAEEEARALLAELSGQALAFRSTAEREGEAVKRELGQHETREALARAIERRQEDLERAEESLADARRASEAARKVVAARARVDEYDRIVREGKDLVEQLEGMDLAELGKAEQRLTTLERDLALEYGKKQREEQLNRKVALGQFDGVCPVAGIACPAKDEINTRSRASQRALKLAEEAARESLQRHGEAQLDLRAAQAKRQAAERLKARVDALREQVRGMRDDYRLAKQEAAPFDVQAIEALVQRCSDAVVQARVELEAMRGSLKRAAASECERYDCAQKGVAVERRLATAREAVLVFGRNGAQRRVAERAMREIEEGANYALEECGIDLRVEVRWSREGQGVARQCDECGQPFPSSLKVKQCGRCGAERGALLIHKLDLALSDRSGAAEDLAGAALQLAASAWLRAERGSAWGTAIIDEPTAQLDAGNRRAFMRHLAAMLRGRYAFEQALVVSHDPAATSMLPGRILVENREGVASARVLA
jgi:DNA repair exonuclease SbcCD ATPase subunit